MLCRYPLAHVWNIQELDAVSGRWTSTGVARSVALHQSRAELARVQPAGARSGDRPSHHPLLERVKFLAIVGSNLDEFFMVRVATLRKRQRAGLEQVSPDGLTVSQQLAAIRDRAAQMMRDQAACWQDRLRPALAEAGVTLPRGGSVHRRDPAVPGSLLQDRHLPAADAAGVRSRPSVSAHLESQQELRGRGPSQPPDEVRARQDPRLLPRFVPLPSSRRSDVRVSRGRHPPEPAASCFPTSTCVDAHLFRVIRDTDMEVQEDAAERPAGVGRSEPEAAARRAAVAAAGRSLDAAPRAEHPGRELRDRGRHRRAQPRSARVLRLDGAAHACRCRR